MSPLRACLSKCPPFISVDCVRWLCTQAANHLSRRHWGSFSSPLAGLESTSYLTLHVSSNRAVALSCAATVVILSALSHSFALNSQQALEPGLSSGLPSCATVLCVGVNCIVAPFNSVQCLSHWLLPSSITVTAFFAALESGLSRLNITTNSGWVGVLDCARVIVCSCSVFRLNNAFCLRHFRVWQHPPRRPGWPCT